MSRRLTDRSKYIPHQGPQEKVRRVVQMARFWSWVPGCKLGPDSMGQRCADFDPNCISEETMARWNEELTDD